MSLVIRVLVRTFQPYQAFEKFISELNSRIAKNQIDFETEGSLYLLVLTSISAFGPVTPVGGVALLASWLILFGCAMAKGSNVATPPSS